MLILNHIYCVYIYVIIMHMVSFFSDCAHQIVQKHLPAVDYINWNELKLTNTLCW